MSPTSYQTAPPRTMEYKGVEIAARNTFIVDPQGKIVRVYTNVDPNKHSAEVLAALDDLQKGTATK
jgi:peroxiredoxin